MIIRIIPQVIPQNAKRAGLLFQRNITSASLFIPYGYIRIIILFNMLGIKVNGSKSDKRFC